MASECDDTARSIIGWIPTNHRIERHEVVESFPNLEGARRYAAWLHRDGAFEGLENYVMGLDTPLC